MIFFHDWTHPIDAPLLPGLPAQFWWATRQGRACVSCSCIIIMHKSQHLHNLRMQNWESCKSSEFLYVPLERYRNSLLFNICLENFQRQWIPVCSFWKIQEFTAFQHAWKSLKSSQFLYFSDYQKVPKSPKKIPNQVSSCTFLALYHMVRNVQELAWFHFWQFLATFLNYS